MTGDGRALSERLAAEVQRHLRRLVLVLEMLTEVEAERDQALAEASGKEAVLLRLKGIGPESAAVPCAEILHRTFASRRGGLRRPGTEPVVRRMMVELAWLWVRFQHGSELSQWFTARVGAAKGRIRRIAIVALAQASGRVVALRRDRSRTHRRRPQGLSWPEDSDWSEVDARPRRTSWPR
ncbi:MAG: transposase family protein [Geminicoccaceae bacterium]|nr:transposase family protein [Geminicoccaceae bacterium]